MGWTAWGNNVVGLNAGFFKFAGQITSAAQAVVLPSALRTGDEVWLFALCFTGGGAAFGAPTGYTLVGSSFAPAWGGTFAIFKHTWTLGDPTSINFTSIPGNTEPAVMVIRPSAGSYVLTKDTTNSGTGASCVFPSFAPSQSVSALRLAVQLSDATVSVGNFVVPAVTKNDDNWTGVGLTGLTNIGNTFGGNLLYSIWSDPGGSDTNTTTVAMGAPAGVGTNWWTRILTLDDSSTVNGVEGTVETDFPLIDPLITAFSMEGGDESLHNEVGIFGGGAHIF